MKITELEKNLHLINYWSNEDEKVIDKLLSNDTDIINDYCKPFSKELNINLLSKESFEAKRDLIKYYIFEFWELQGFYKEYNDILFTGSLCNYTPIKYEHTDRTEEKRKLNEFENYVINSHILFDMLFNEIQICCIKYKIDFFKICYELSFSLEYLDSGISLAFREMKKESKPTQHESKSDKNLTIRQKVENAFSFMQSVDIRKHQLILNEADFNDLINWVTYYFENNFVLPKIIQPIQEVNTNKGNVIYTFLRFFKIIHPAQTRPESLFKLIKACFYEYKDDKIDNLKKQKKPQYYNDLISKK